MNLLDTLIELFYPEYNNVCSITKLKEKHVTFLRSSSNKEYVKQLLQKNKDVWVLVSQDFDIDTILNTWKTNVKFFKVDNPDYAFTIYNNFLALKNKSKTIEVHPFANIHPTTILGADGLRIVKDPYGDNIQFIHIGGILIESDVEIGPYCVIHRATLDDTIIQKGTKIGAMTNIGHNCNIGENVVIGVQVCLNGSIVIGNNCWISSGVNIKNGITICDNVVIGMGSNVVKSITEPGIYWGTPAEYKQPYRKDWNF